MSNSYSTTGRVTGHRSVGGLVGWTGFGGGTISNSYYSYDAILVNGKNMITVGALFGGDFEQWLANDKFLDVNEQLAQEAGYYLINDVDDFKQLLAFGQDSSLRFRLKNDLDLGHDPNFYIPYLAGEFDGNGHKISNLRLSFDSVSPLGLFGYVAPGGKVTQVGVEDVNVTGNLGVGGLAGGSLGTVSNSYSAGKVIGGIAGGLVGWNAGTVSNSYSSGSVNGHGVVGGLMGWNYQYYSTVINSYSTSDVTGDGEVGGLVGRNEGTVGNSFWDTETSGQSTSAGGTGKTTTEMKSIATFSGAGWNIIAVANAGTRNPSYIWNIVDGQTYPFLGWESI
jgi:hypothetical protein